MKNKAQTKNMNQTAKRSLKPKLRFPEFRDAAGWSETKLKNVLTEHKLKSDGKSEVHSVSVHKGVVNQKEHLGRSFAAADTSNYNLAKPYDVIYTKSPTGDFPYGVIKHNHNSYNVIVSPLYGVFSPINKYLGYIFDAYFESPIRTSNYLAPITQKGAKNTLQISNETFLSSGIYLPHEEAEQQKIADCLFSLDELITAEAQKLDTLKAHKKGLLQQLFPAEGETLPKLRFPEFLDEEEWEEEKLGSLVEIFSGDAPSLHKLSSTHGCPYVKVEDMNNCSKYQSTSREYAEKSTKNLPMGSVIFPKRGAAIMGNKVRIAAVPFYIDTNMMALFPRNTSSLSSEFLYYLIVTQQLSKIADTSSIPQINNKHIIAYTVAIPLLPEQQKIANCLSSIDEIITAQTHKLDALKAHKKGLMQQLFPAFDEVKG
jgi:type I restriction enzyme, S subunit